LSSLGLKELPEAIGVLAQLQILYLFNNQLTKLPTAIGQLAQLRELWLNNNQLRALPASIDQLTQLQRLVLSGNRLSKLPASINQLGQLEILSLYNNKLTALPESIGQLTQLKELYVYNNQLTILPESIGQLEKFQRIDLSQNKLTALPESIRHLKLLQQLYLHNNHGLGLLAEVLGPAREDVHEQDVQHNTNPEEIFEYYFRVRIDQHPLNEAKLILVGRGAVGKTSLVNRLVYNRFDKREKKTEGIQITEWPLRLNRKEQVRLNIWDFGGQEIMHTTHQFFLSERSLYLLVLNGREGGEDMDVEY
jgi:internalin A